MYDITIWELNWLISIKCMGKSSTRWIWICQIDFVWLSMSFILTFKAFWKASLGGFLHWMGIGSRPGCHINISMGFSLLVQSLPLFCHSVFMHAHRVSVCVRASLSLFEAHIFYQRGIKIIKNNAYCCNVFSSMLAFEAITFKIILHLVVCPRSFLSASRHHNSNHTKLLPK